VQLTVVAVVALEATASRLKSGANSDALARLFGEFFHFGKCPVG
jgi:hypothetical protein